MKETKAEIVLFETKDKSVSLPVEVKNETVWLSANQMSHLFERDEKTIRKHINNVFSEGELEKENNTQKNACCWCEAVSAVLYPRRHHLRRLSREIQPRRGVPTVGKLRLAAIHITGLRSQSEPHQTAG